MALRRFSCCGVKEISRISYYPNPLAVLKRYVADVRIMYGRPIPRPFTPGGAHLFFTQAGKGRTYGENLAAYIEANNLGTIIRSPGRVNPNSGNNLIVFLWTLNQKNLKAWVAKHKV